MPMRRTLPILALLAATAAVPAAVRAQIAEAVPPPTGPANLAVVLESAADSPEFAVQRAECRLQNVAEVVRQLGATVSRAERYSAAASPK